MNRIVKAALVAVACWATAASCVKDVVMDAMEEPAVVVDCILTDEPVQTLHLVYTKGASREAAPDLPEATAVLTDLTEGKEAGRFARTADGSWTLAYAAIPEHRYRLDVTVPGHEPIWAEQTMPEPPGVVVGWHRLGLFDERPSTSYTTSHAGYEFRFTQLRDPVWFYGMDYTDMDSPGETTPYLCTNAPGVDQNNLAGEGVLYRDEEFSGGHYLWGQPNRVGFRTTCYSVLDGQPLHKGYLRFPAVDTAPKDTFAVSGYFRGYISDISDFVHAEMRPAELRYCSVSEDYDRFLQDGFHMKEIKNSTDLSSIFVRDNLFSNVQGALGIFGATVERVLEWEGRDSWQANGFFVLGGALSGFTTAGEGTLPADHDLIIQSRPFELIHFEYYRFSSLEDAPEWTPLTRGPLDGPTGSYYEFEIIEDQETLKARGLGSCGTIDFSRKKILLLSIATCNIVPFMIGYGIPTTGGFDGYYPVGGYVPFFGYCYLDSSGEYGSDGFLDTPFRFAIAVDKDDRIWSSDDGYWVYYESRYDQFRSVPYYGYDLHYFPRLRGTLLSRALDRYRP